MQLEGGYLPLQTPHHRNRVILVEVVDHQDLDRGGAYLRREAAQRRGDVLALVVHRQDDREGQLRAHTARLRSFQP